MSDNTWLHLEVAEKDLPAVMSVLGEPNGISKDEESVVLYFEEANCGGEQELLEIAEKCIPFLAESGEGSDFGSTEVVSIGDGNYEQYEKGKNGGYVVYFDEKGDPNPKDLEEIRKFIMLKNKAQELISA